MLKPFIILATCLTMAACTMSDNVPAYKNPNLPVSKRVDDLISRMTVEEKLGQLLCPLGWPMYEKTETADGATVGVSDEYRKFVDEQFGGMLWATFRADPWTRKTLDNGLNPKLAAEAYNALQKYAIDSTRLGIPIILAEEAPHGHMAIGATVFPTSIGLASTWDKALITEVGKTIASELRAQGGHIGYGPVIDLAREPRWSRVEETYGEDTYLTSQMAAAMVKGTSPKHNGWDKGVISTLKHFVAYGIPEGGHNGNPSNVGERDLYENFLPAFQAAVDAGALSVMTSYNSIDGVPSTGNPELLRRILKEEWGFDGFVVSDLVSIDGLFSDHHIAKDKEDAGIIAMNAGVDVDLGANCYVLLKEAVETGKIKASVINEAVARVLRLKFELGLFDNPYVDPDYAEAEVRKAENVAVARQAARKGVVLLENNGVLPLSKDMKVAVIGPNADNMYNQLGDYTAPQPRENIRTVLDGIKAKVGEKNVTYVKGCAIRDTKDNTIAEAVRAARRADVAVVVVGGSSARDFKTTYKETGAAVADKNSISDMEAGEGFDRASLSLLGLQNELLTAVKKSGTPVVVVYIEGRPLDKRWAKANADALLTQFYPGQQGGDALADVLFGEFNPAGRLPVSVPYDAGQVPVYYNKKFPKGHDYVEMPSDALYPFGYGLSYTTFEYSDLKLEALGGNQVKVYLNVKNTGKYDGEEVVQTYVTDLVASTVRPRKQLRAFERVAVPAGETVAVEMILDESAFIVYDRQMNPVVEPGEFTIAVGASSDDIRLKQNITL
ncbi:MAG: glycoside hydrolase family 3 C-terminal domain-containing protein [Bacteroidales bacterium]|nr:glycoside hydrolase family 3 C-terminal domain-containing protein [Bacteroidales bacterium]